VAQDGGVRVLPRGIRRRESKAGRFTRLAERRVTEALDHLRLVGNLANRRNYDFTKEQADQIVAALDAALRQVRVRFSEGAPSPSDRFRFRK
jgi:hypothetical protein